jgi:hypothetical protein
MGRFRLNPSYSRGKNIVEPMALAVEDYRRAAISRRRVLYVVRFCRSFLFY